LKTVDGTAKTGLRKGSLALTWQARSVKPVLSRIYACQRIPWKVATSTMIGHVHSESLLTVVTPEMIHLLLLLALQLVLDALAIGRIPNQRQNRPNAVHK
jgi:hypothetical protein